MKRSHIVLVGLAALTFASCKKSGEEQGVRIGFSPAAEAPLVKGTPIRAAADIANMVVYGYYTGNGASNNWAAKGATATPAYFNGITITNSGGTWNSPTPAYWPQASDANVTFFAYSPAATASNGIAVASTTGIPKLTYTVPTSCANQPDLMVSALLNDLNRTSGNNVSFPMRHALTSIGFKVTGNGEKITKIKVSGAKTTGTLTTAADGTPSWSLTGSPSGDFEATVDGGITLGSTPQQANTGDGYLMMIPQTLPAGAKVVVTLNDGRDVEFDLGGQNWTAGQIINYGIGITSVSSIVISPDNILIPKAGGYSSFNVIEQDDKSNVSWTVNSDQSWILICDNLADLKAWAAGTRTTANVKNLDGSTPGQSYSYTTPSPSVSGSGTKTLYAWVNTQNSSDVDSQTGIISLDSDPAVQTTVTQLRNIKPSDVATGSTLANAYVGAFWRANQTGERIIRIPVSGAAAGAWSASILTADANWPADLALFSTTPSSDAGITWTSATENPADMIDNDAVYQVTDGQILVSGTVANGEDIYFRIGLKSTYTPTEAAPARYAVVLLAYGTPVKYHAIFLRQGHDPDYVMRPSDACNSGGFNSATRPSAVRFSPYNLTSPNLNPAVAGTQIQIGKGVFTRYPSQAGAFFQWTGKTGLERYAYHPINPMGVVSGWVANTGVGFWYTLAATHETCPANYTLGTAARVDFRRPNDGTITTANTTGSVISSEIRQSLWLNPQTGSISNITNSIWGFYADGFFDRRALNTAAYGSAGSVKTAVSYYTPATDPRNSEVAYIGRLFFNSNTYGSLFFPAAGIRFETDGGLSSTGSDGCYWSGSIYGTPSRWSLYLSKSSANEAATGRNNGLAIRCVRP